MLLSPIDAAAAQPTRPDQRRVVHLDKRQISGMVINQLVGSNWGALLPVRLWAESRRTAYDVASV
jgi:hypothetical protein